MEEEEEEEEEREVEWEALVEECEVWELVLGCEEEEADEEAKTTKARVEANLNREQCDRVRGQIITLGQSSQIIIYTTDAQGQRTAMDDAAKVRERQRLEAWVRESCKS